MIIKILSTVILSLIVIGFVWLFRSFDILGTSRERKNYTYRQIADDFDFWNRYVNDDDPNNRKNMSRLEHNGYSTEEKLNMLISNFGREK